MTDQIVLVYAPTQQETPRLILPFVLQISAGNPRFLLKQMVISDDFVFQCIMVILCTEGEIGWHKEQVIELMEVL